MHEEDSLLKLCLPTGGTEYLVDFLLGIKQI